MKYTCKACGHVKTIPNKPLRTIHLNAFGNWDGYENGERVKMFCGTQAEQEAKAREWVNENLR